MTRRASRLAAAAALLSIVVCLPFSQLAAATHDGRNVDGPRYHGSIMNDDYGLYDDLEIKFQGGTVFVYFPAGGRMVLLLDDEEIANPHAIPAYDPRRGISWEIDIVDMTIR